MADKPVNQAPEQSDALYSLYARENNTTNRFTQIPANQFAHAVGLTGSDKGKTPYVDANGDMARLTIGGSGAINRVSSGLPSWLALGTANQLLRVNAGATDVEWASVSPSVMSQISSQTISSSVASVVFTGIPTSGYSKFILEGKNVISAAAATSSSLLVQVSTDGGSTFKTTSGDYYKDTTASPALCQAIIPGSTSTFQYGDFTIHLIGLGNSSRATSGSLMSNSYGVSTTNIGRKFPDDTGGTAFTRSAAEADTAFRLIVTGANLTAGKITLYGVTEA